MIDKIEIQTVHAPHNSDRVAVYLSLYPAQYKLALDPTLVIEDEVELITAKCRQLITNWCQAKGLL